MQKAEGLERLLDRIYGAVMAGDLSQIGAMGAEVEGLLADLPRLDATLAEKMRQKATRNAACLQAAARGVRAARRRISEIRAAQAGLATYDGQGKRMDLAQNDGQLARRY